MRVQTSGRGVSVRQVTTVPADGGVNALTTHHVTVLRERGTQPLGTTIAATVAQRRKSTRKNVDRI